MHVGPLTDLLTLAVPTTVPNSAYAYVNGDIDAEVITGRGRVAPWPTNIAIVACPSARRTSMAALMPRLMRRSRRCR